MLSSLHAFSKTWIAKILFGILIVSFGAFGISNVITDIGTNTVARVGGEDITMRDYQRAYQAQLNNAAQQLGSVPTNEQAVAMGIPGTVLGQLAANAAINQMAVGLGLGVSEQRLGKMLREDPSFSGTLGQFDRTSFLRVLQQNSYTEAEYFELQTRAARRNQLAAGLFADAAVPKTAIDLVKHYAGDTRTISYFVLNAASMLPVAEPTDADLGAYLTAHQAEFRTRETRTADILVLSPEALAGTKTITDEEIAAEYERTKQSLSKPERRTIQQVVLPTDAAKAAFTAGQAAGKSLADLAAANNLPVNDLGTMAKSEVTDAALANAAFGLASGSFTIIPGAAGQRAVGVSAIDPGGAPALADAHNDIAASLALAEGRKEFPDVLDQVEELRAAFQPMSEIAKRLGLPLTEVKLTAAGAELSAVALLPEEDRARVAQTIFAAQKEKLAPTVPLSSNRNLWFDLKAIDPARDQTLAEVHDQVLAAWTTEKTEQAEAAEAQKLVDELKAGKSFDDVATATSQFPSLSQPMTRTGDGTPVIDATIATAAFGGGKGHFGSAKNGEGDYVVFQVEDVAPATADNPQATQFAQTATRDALFADFVAGLRQDYGVHENQSAISQLLSTGGQ